MTLKLTPEEAGQQINKINSERDTVISALNKIGDTQHQMLGGNWQGGSATKYNNLSATQHEDVTQIISYLTQIVDTATTQLGKIANADNG